jgi:hypothetical protein
MLLAMPAFLGACLAILYRLKMRGRRLKLPA